MKYVRKTVDVWHVQGDYGQGWETVTSDESYLEIRARLHEYRENEPRVVFRVKLLRERKEA